jgi:hypothetical protein
MKEIMPEYSIGHHNFKRFLLIACEVLHRELFFCAARSKNIVDIEFCSQGYHDLPCGDMRSRIQERISRAGQGRYDAILLGFGLCSNGISGISAGKIPVVIPRAHDCITLLLGSKERYRENFDSEPGTYYLSSGWIERDSDNLEDLKGMSVMSRLGLDCSIEELSEKYGAENAQFIISSIGGGIEKNYTAISFINTGLGNIEAYRETGCREAEKGNLLFKEINGNLSLLQKLMDGDWSDEEFLILTENDTVCQGDDIMILKKGKKAQ